MPISRVSSLIVFFVFLRTLQGVESEVRTFSTSTFETNCSSLQLEQYFCSPEIDPSTQQPKGCSKNNLAHTICMAADGIQCVESGNNTFPKEIPCLWTNGYSFETSLLLSVFLGMFGADRFYLGYPAIGLFKLCTLGCMFLGQIVDIILIATQTVGPADGSHYIINYFGPRLSRLELDNDTYRMPQFDWPEL
ncbi:TM2 domain-containing protein CG10795-like [Daphnia pulex]|uniref:TM2 domain-containing protein CG10795-like n=1 Tax=Daphnia pulex TaxID=6669 RepID=UPI001EDCC4DC|nr:TM2 domain-containing protein CG10795-like [Daphnia pulex]